MKDARLPAVDWRVSDPISELLKSSFCVSL
jgi:hypothetical protein